MPNKSKNNSKAISDKIYNISLRSSSIHNLRRSIRIQKKNEFQSNISWTPPTQLSVVKRKLLSGDSHLLDLSKETWSSSLFRFCHFTALKHKDDIRSSSSRSPPTRLRVVGRKLSFGDSSSSDCENRHVYTDNQSNSETPVQFCCRFISDIVITTFEQVLPTPIHNMAGGDQSVSDQAHSSQPPPPNFSTNGQSSTTTSQNGSLNSNNNVPPPSSIAAAFTMIL